MLDVRWRDRLHNVAGALKALAAILITVVLAAADYYDAIPLGPLLQQYLGDQAATKIALWAPILFGTLRYVSTNQVGCSSKSAVDEGQ